MKCPSCSSTFKLEDLCVSPAYMASDFSYATAETNCPNCNEELQLYYPLTEVNGEKI